jgi:osmotically-inducible protein OsmY
MCPRTGTAESEEDRKEGALMKSDAEIRDDVINELQWDPHITNPDAIGVAVTDGAVTLTGHVATYPERLAAARAAERVYGVKAVANDLKVKLSGAPRDDTDIARAIAHVLEWNVQVPEGKVHARVQDGWVTLEGEVEYEYQRHAVERSIRQVRGVVGVTDTITVRPPGTSGWRYPTTPPSSTATCTRCTRQLRPVRRRPRHPGSPPWRATWWSPRRRHDDPSG